MTHETRELTRINDLAAVRIGLAGPDTIRAWSQGEVTRPETVNYRTHRPERDGLFCERIFGPEKDWECRCGKYRGIKHKGTACDRCGVEVTHSRVRRKRMGHIELAAPVAHIWFVKARPSPLAAVLGLKAAELERVIYHQAPIVLEPGPTDLQRGEVIAEDQARALAAQHGAAFRAGMGAEAIEELLRQIDLAKLVGSLRRQVAALRRKPRPPAERLRQLARRLEVIEPLARSGNRPEWMVLRVLPVLPPDLRPIVLLESGQYVTSDLNDLYRRVLQRNGRLRKLMEIHAPEVILRNERRLLQQGVDALFDNSRCASPALAQGRRPLKSLADMLKGKQGRFRENLLGKRVDYSGRSVIVVGPHLALHQCGLPKGMALELFQPFLVRQLRQRDPDLTLHRARRLIQARGEIVWEALEAAMKGHPVLLNRAPTLHRMGIQAFEPVLVEGNAIQLHPLVCKAFNADFDGDQMAVHLPLSVEAQTEAKELLAPARNVFSPASGQPIITPSKDMVLGCYYLSCQLSVVSRQQDRRAFAGPGEVLRAMTEGKLGVHDAIVVRLPAAREVISERPLARACEGWRRVATTAGRVVLNDVLPAGMPFYDLAMSAKNLSRLIADCGQRLGQAHTVALLERLMRLGFREATRSGLSFAASDLCVPADKEAIVARAQQKADRLVSRYEEGMLSAKERYEKVTGLWEDATRAVADRLMAALADDRRPGQAINPLHAMVASGARGSASQIGQLAGMRGPMRRPSGEVLEQPIKASFREGLSSLEYFNSTHGVRKALTDMALKTSDSGYLTRKLVDAAQSVVITEPDCGAVARGPRQCRAARGLCQQCYGTDRSTGALVAIGTAVGVIAAQSIGEPATQLTMRTFHHGGASTASDITLSLPRVIELFEARAEVREVFRTRGADATAAYLLEEIQKVYRLHGVEVDDKHIEVILSRMLPRDGGRLLGVSKAAVQSDSFLSAASFQETTKVLADAALAGRVDELRGLKENVLLGRLIPAGTGLRPR